MDDCVFCKIIKGEIPSYKIYEDSEFFVFLDIQPLTKGHVLVIPKQHYRWVWDVPNVGGYFEVVRKIALAQKKAFKTDFIVSLVFGEEVAHAHVWLVPRTDGDGHGNAIKLENRQTLAPDEMASIQAKILAEL